MFLWGGYLFLAVQETFYLWHMKDLLPTYERNGQKQGKTGIFCKKRYFFGNFTQLRLERARRFSVFLLYSAQKFPTKITGNFSEPNRELSANIRELYFSPAPLETTQTAPTLPNFDIAGSEIEYTDGTESRTNKKS